MSCPGMARSDRDEKLKSLEAEAIITGSSFCLDHLDDFAVLILFSVFESVVRAQVLSEVEDERDGCATSSSSKL